MKRSQYSHLSAFGCKAGTVLLAWAFSAGLLVGALLSGDAQPVFDRTRDAFSCSAGVSLWIPVLMPLLFSGFAVYAGWSVLLIPVAFWKALSFSYVATGVISAWGSAGWLVFALAMFASSCSLPVLWWYWLQHIGGEGFRGRTFLTALGAMLLIGWAELLVISPFLLKILIF